MLVGIVPMGGAAERWQPYPCPKELLPFGTDEDGCPRVIGDYVIDCMMVAGVEMVIIPVRPDKATLVLKYFGHQLANRAPIVYVSAPGPTLLANLQACIPLLQGHRVMFGMPDTYFLPRTAFVSCLEVLEPSVELVLGSFRHQEPSGLDLVDRGGQVLLSVRPKPRPPDDPGNEVWGIAVWSDDFTERLAAWSPVDGPTPGFVFQAAAVSGRARCVFLADGLYEDLASYQVYQRAQRLLGVA